MLKSLLLICIALALVVVLYGLRNIRCRAPYNLPRALPWKLIGRARVSWRERPFCGWGRDWFGVTRFAFGTREDSVGVVGPPRVGKTAGVLIPQALMWGGPLISTSTKPDILRATAGRRLQLAQRHGGKVFLYAPTANGRIEGMEPARWSPLAGCQDPRIAALRVETLVQAAQTGRGIENADHWRAGASRILRPYFLAAAHHPTRRGDFAVVREWLAGHEFRDPLAILASLRTFGGDHWAAELRGVAETPERERGSFFSSAQNAVAATADPNVLRSCSATDLEPIEFLTTRSTLYVISPSEHQEAVAPLISALIEYIVTVAYDLHRQGMLPARLGLGLDELANIAPLPKLESIVSQGGGQGVNTTWAAQSQAQLRHRFGEHAADAIWSATRSKLVFGGLGDGRSLEQLSRLVGDHQIKTRTTATDRSSGVKQHHTTTGLEWRPRLSVAELRQLPPKWALLLYQERKPYVVRAPIAARRWRLRRVLLPWPVTLAPPVVSEQPAVQQAQPNGRVPEGIPLAQSGRQEVGAIPGLRVVQPDGVGPATVVEAEE
jgi:type IV secretion system protein VirD4